jgi:hypothetical protein
MKSLMQALDVDRRLQPELIAVGRLPRARIKAEFRTMRIIFALLLTLIFSCTSATLAHSIEVGDVIWLSTKGVGKTVTAVKRPSRETIELTALAMDANAAEYCERYEKLSLFNDAVKYKKCIREHVSSVATQIVLNCRTATIILGGDTRGSGSYRRSPGRGWTSVVNPNWKIHPDFFEKACAGH